jgi:hypothetical protein
MNQHFGLIGKTAAGIDAVFAVGQFDPLALAFRVIRVAVAGYRTCATYSVPWSRMSRLAFGFL